MPELPEVETVKNMVKPLLEGATITSVKVMQPKLRWPIPTDLADCLVGQPINSIQRRAKYILFGNPLGNMIIHLGMTGTIQERPGEQIHKHDRVIFTTKDHRLCYNDVRKFGAILWTTGSPFEHNLLKKLGPEPLTDDFNIAYLKEKCRRSYKPIKPFIMANSTVVGVGNIYAAESLFLSKIKPKRPASTLTATEISDLVLNIKQVLKKAINAGGTTLRDFKGTDGKPGYFKQSLLVYGRGGKECVNCRHILEQITLAQRSSVFCPNCQH